MVGLGAMMTWPRLALARQGRVDDSLARLRALAPSLFSAHFRDNGSIARVGLSYRFY
jgi:hypothetical protein